MPLPPKACTTAGCREMQPCKQHPKKKWVGGAQYSNVERRRMKLVREAARHHGDRCGKCGKVDHKGQVDHKKNKAEGGSDELTNMWFICTGCHIKKTMQERLRGLARRKR